MTRSLAEHRVAALALLSQMPTLDVLVSDAVGGMLAEDLVADTPMPAIPMAACDGYAIRAHDVAQASRSSPVTLAVSHDVDFDTRSRRRHVGGTAAAVVSGVPMPDGADAVVRAADTDRGLARVAVARAVGPGENIRPAGTDAASGEVMVPRGTRIGPRQLGVAAALGRSRLLVRPVPRVVVIAVGSELVEPGTARPGGGVPESSAHMITVALRAAGAHAYRVGSVPDDRFVLTETLEDQLVRADVIITTGALSGAPNDTLPAVLRHQSDVEVVDLDLRPGLRHGLGTLDTGRDGRGVPVFALPGAPLAAMAAFEAYVRPALRAMSGHDAVERRTVNASAAQGWETEEGLDTWVPLTLDTDADGHYVASPCGSVDPWSLRALAQANGYMLMGSGHTRVSAGDHVTCAVWDA